MSKLRKNTVAKATKLPSSPINSEGSCSESDAESDVESKRRRKPTKKSRLNYHQYEHLLPHATMAIASTHNDKAQPSHNNYKTSIGDASDLQSNCKDSEVSSSNIILQEKTHEMEKLHKILQTSYMDIETEMLMVYILFFTIAPYLLYSGIKYDNRALLSIGVVLLLCAITNIFMLLWK